MNKKQDKKYYLTFCVTQGKICPVVLEEQTNIYLMTCEAENLEAAENYIVQKGIAVRNKYGSLDFTKEGIWSFTSSEETNEKNYTYEITLTFFAGSNDPEDTDKETRYILSKNELSGQELKQHLENAKVLASISFQDEKKEKHKILKQIKNIYPNFNKKDEYSTYKDGINITTIWNNFHLLTKLQKTDKPKQIDAVYEFEIWE